jgi:putative YhdH/YhfP family quinone oxidoreductase
MTARALFVSPTAERVAHILPLDLSILDGEVLIEVRYSSCNYKDAMVIQPGNRIARRDPLIGGVDLAGVIIDPGSSGRSPGDEVIVHGYDLGVAHHGGFSTHARVDASWLVDLPPKMTLRQSMEIGTAGFTAFASLKAIVHAGVSPESGDLLVTGATGGVGSAAVVLGAQAGYRVVASSGKTDASDYLVHLGASAVIGRSDIGDLPERVLASPRFGGAIDCVGGETLAQVLRSLTYGGCVAASGLTGGSALATTVYPFIVRGVTLAGIDVVQMPLARRQRLWNELAESDLDALCAMATTTVTLDEVIPALHALHNGEVTGRIVVES